MARDCLMDRNKIGKREKGEKGKGKGMWGGKGEKGDWKGKGKGKGDWKGKGKGKEILVEKERGRRKEDIGEPQPGEKDTRGFVTSAEKRDTRLEKDCARFKRWQEKS